MKFGIRKKVITRSDNLPYLIRYTLFTCRWFSIKIHKILKSDDACMHDHPWAFISIILAGGYVEYAYKIIPGKGISSTVLKDLITSRIYHPFSILYRPAKYAHRLEVHKPATTLVITFKKTRLWGFFTPKGWLYWRNYHQENICD